MQETQPTQQISLLLRDFCIGLAAISCPVCAPAFHHFALSPPGCRRVADRYGLQPQPSPPLLVADAAPAPVIAAAPIPTEAIVVVMKRSRTDKTLSIWLLHNRFVAPGRKCGSHQACPLPVEVDEELSDVVVDALRLRTHPATESHTRSERQDRDHHRANHGACCPIAGDQTAPLTANLNPPSSTATRYTHPLSGFVSPADRRRRTESSPGEIPPGPGR